MASSGKKKTTSMKRARENQLRERRIEKQAKKAARRLAAAEKQERPTEIGREPVGRRPQL
jgi:hypothetical protein